MSNLDDWQDQWNTIVQKYKEAIVEKDKAQEELLNILQKNFPAKLIIKDGNNIKEISNAISAEIVPGSTCYQFGIRFTRIVDGRFEPFVISFESLIDINPDMKPGAASG